MTAFLDGQTPRVYQEVDVFSFSKVGFTSRICRMLDTVGMVPMTGLWPFDIFENPEQEVDNTFTPYVFPFDYPDTGTFTISSTTYRPCVVVVMWIGDLNANTNITFIQNNMAVIPAIRVAGNATTLDDIRVPGRERGVANNGYGVSNLTIDLALGDVGGSFVGLSTWRPFEGHGFTDDDTIAVGNLFAYLGPGGLCLHIGSGPQRASFGDLLALQLIASGSRIPGRALPEVSDFNLNRINPMIPFYLVEEGNASDVWDTGVNSEFLGILRGKTHGMQFNVKFTTSLIQSFMFNLENIEVPIFPAYAPDTLNSPRALSGGGGGHILGRLVHVPDHEENDDGDKYGPVIPSLASDDVRPEFYEVFTSPGFTFCDKSAPLGEFEDPLTLLNWRIVPAYNTQSLIGLLVEGGTTVSALDTLSKQQTGSDAYDMTASGWSSSFPTPVTITETRAGTPGTYGIWDDNHPGLDRQSFDNPPSPGTDNEEILWEIQLNASDPISTFYELSWSASNREDPQRNGDAQGTNPLTVEYLFNGSFLIAHTLLNAGTDTTDPAYNLAPYTVNIPKDTSSGDPHLRIRWRTSGANNIGAIGEVEDIVINKFRYL